MKWDLQSIKSWLLHFFCNIIFNKIVRIKQQQNMFLCGKEHDINNCASFVLSLHTAKTFMITQPQKIRLHDCFQGFVWTQRYER